MAKVKGRLAVALLLMLAPALAAAGARESVFSAGDYISGRNVLQGLESVLPVFLPTGKVASTLNEDFYKAQLAVRLKKMGLGILKAEKDEGRGVTLSKLARPTMVYKVSTMESSDGTVVYYADLELREGIVGKSMSSKRELMAAMPVLWSRGGLGFISQDKLQSHLSKILDQLLGLFSSDFHSANENTPH
jgi:hypothetical protein